MKKFINVPGKKQRILIDSEQIKGFFCFNISEISKGMYVIIEWLNNEKPTQLEFSDKNLGDTFYRELISLTEATYPLNWINHRMGTIDESISLIEQELKKINKKLYNLMKNKK